MKISDNRKIINNLVIINDKKNSFFWGREAKLAKRLITEYGIDFALWLKPPSDLKVYSLLWFFAPEGLNFLNEKFFEFKKQTLGELNRIEKVILSNTKFGEDLQIKEKIKTLKDFIK